MSDDALPTELQCLARSVQETASQHVSALSALPMLVAAASGTDATGQQPDFLGVVQGDMPLVDARQMQFNARRLVDLIDLQTSDLRDMYSLTVEMVDHCRQAPILPGASASEFAERQIALVARLQEVLEGWFPDEYMPGD